MKRDESNRGILVSDKILIFSLYVGCFYHKGPALTISAKQLSNFKAKWVLVVLLQVTHLSKDACEGHLDK